ncbi:heptahelical transmembrane protein 4-like isoform X1 [Malus sylvestris]|uniref:heptahelical transmembrane protein 4-like isoform X1 n=2 Tax=Malus sylvestris TaxID=3752 RepID=UPI0021AD0C77|nr:heptahelical transmembrane protein 4-like isoform X1 [Malus sylvestris]XP_050144162.1 heptahelical transmembrane protein 4-like isoform X1 [Malus sylvestris]
MGGDSPLSETRSEENQFDREDVNETCSKEAKGKRLRKKVKYQLIEYHSLPDFLRDNEFILGHYRSEWPLKQVFLSIFSIHNQTLNVWTHLIGFFLFLFLTIYTATKAPDLMDLSSLQRLSDMIRRADLHRIHPELLNCLPSLSLPSMDFPPSASGNIRELLANCLPDRFSHGNQTENSVLDGVMDDVMNMVAPLMYRPITRRPFFVFLGGVMFCLLASSTCHPVACHSARLSSIMQRCDYAGITVLIMTSFYPTVYYSFMCNPFLCNLYLGFITVLGITTMVFSQLPFFQGPKFRSHRASLFFGMGVSSVVPIVHKLILFRNQPEATQTAGYEVLMGVVNGLGALIYATRIPERWRPGKFDIPGSSHQLFHILVVAAAYIHYRAGLLYLRWRDLKGC